MKIKRLDHVNFITHTPEETIKFYCDVIGLKLGESLSIDTSDSLYFYIPGQDVAILHIGNAKVIKQQPKFQCYAELDEKNGGHFSTGSFDHFCLAVDYNDYHSYLQKLESVGVEFKTYCHDDIKLNQVWIIDPNGVRVELNFT